MNTPCTIITAEAQAYIAAAMEVAAGLTGCSVNEMLCPLKERRMVRGRALFSVVMRQQTKASYPAIARMLKRQHPVAIRWIRRHGASLTDLARMAQEMIAERGVSVPTRIYELVPRRPMRKNLKRTKTRKRDGKTAKVAIGGPTSVREKAPEPDEIWAMAAKIRAQREAI